MHPKARRSVLSVSFHSGPTFSSWLRLRPGGDEPARSAGQTQFLRLSSSLLDNEFSADSHHSQPNHFKKTPDRPPSSDGPRRSSFPRTWTLASRLHTQPTPHSFSSPYSSCAPDSHISDQILLTSTAPQCPAPVLKINLSGRANLKINSIKKRLRLRPLLPF